MKEKTIIKAEKNNAIQNLLLKKINNIEKYLAKIILKE